MKKVAFFAIAALLLGIGSLVSAQEFPDVPPDHWAYDAVQELVDAGVLQGYPDGTYGGKRAMTRYEFAEALAKSIPVIREMVTAGDRGPAGPAGPAGTAGPAGPPGPGAPGAEEVKALQRLVDEFRDELAAQGVDIEALRRDVAALNERVIALEEEVARVRWTGDVNLIARGTVENAGTALDRDSRGLGDLTPTDADNPLANSRFLTDIQLGVKGRVSDDASVNALIAAGNYLQDFAIPGVDDFTLWHLNLDAAARLGPLGPAQIVVGRFPFQLTPLTLKFVDPDSYTYVDKLDSGDFVLDGGRISLNLGRVALTGFAAKADPIADLISPDLATPSALGYTQAEVTQLAGGRAVIGTPLGGSLGLTWYGLGLDPTIGVLEVMGADISANLGNFGVAAEFAQTDPSEAMVASLPAIDNDNSAWNANLSWQTGNLALTGGFTTVEENYIAPGYWSRIGRAVNLTNVEGPTASLTYALTPRISFSAEGQFLEPENSAAAVTGRSSIVQGSTAVTVGAADLDKVTYWKAGIKYGLTSANSVDLGFEQVSWEPTAAAGTKDTEERYISIGIGHSFNPNASLKLLYQIVEYEQGAAAVDPYGSGANYRGGVATAQFDVRF